MLGWNGINLLNIYGGFYECMDIDEKGWMNQYFQIVLQLDLGKCQSFLVATTRFFLGGGQLVGTEPQPSVPRDGGTAAQTPKPAACTRCCREWM